MPDSDALHQLTTHPNLSAAALLRQYRNGLAVVRGRLAQLDHVGRSNRGTSLFERGWAFLQDTGWHTGEQLQPSIGSGTGRSDLSGMYFQFVSYDELDSALPGSNNGRGLAPVQPCIASGNECGLLLGFAALASE